MISLILYCHKKVTRRKLMYGVIEILDLWKNYIPEVPQNNLKSNMTG